MDASEFEEIFEKQVQASRDLLVQKAKEYATEDRLHNFKVAAVLRGTTPRGALSGMLVKHTVSLYDLMEAENCASWAVWQEKLGDHLNYLYLLAAIISEEIDQKNLEQMKDAG